MLSAYSFSAVAAEFTLEQVRDYPYHTSLTASAQGSRIAWSMEQQGRRNIWVAEGPDFVARALTRYDQDDGQELTSLRLSSNGEHVVYVRGGEHGSNWETNVPVNVLSTPLPPKVQIWSLPFAGGEPRLLGEGDNPSISPRGDQVAFLRDGALWSVPIDGSTEARTIVKPRGSVHSIAWSPDGSRLAFVVSRESHSLIGVYQDTATPLVWLAPAMANDASPTWSADGTRIAYIRRPGRGGAPEPIMTPAVRPWSLWIADARTGKGAPRWSSPLTLLGSKVSELYWAIGDRIVFNSYAGGWPQMYSVRVDGGDPVLLTPGKFMVEQSSISPDRRHLLLTVNTGPEADDGDRRHLMRVDVEHASTQLVTSGTGLEWSPVVTGDGRYIAHFSATAQRPAFPAIMPFKGGRAQLLATSTLPAEYPQRHLVTPRKVTFQSADGMTVHGQLFEPRENRGKRPAVVYIHGGPQRQMLLGWHASDYYSNAYAVNQYLVSRGFVVLSVNYRLGIGYGYDFHYPREAGAFGASEYRDIVAAGKYLQSLTSVDARRIGVYGGSYGGYLTAMALAHDSDLFAAGVDIHGVHDWSASSWISGLRKERYEQAPDAAEVSEIAWKSSPVSAVATWKSPVLFIHGDDDRNVLFSQSVDLARRLEQHGIKYEALVLPGETHHAMLHSNALTINRAVVEFLEKHLRAGHTPQR